MQNKTYMPTGADEFTSANLHGLEEWATSATELMDTNYNLGAGFHLAATQGLPLQLRPT